MKGDNRKRLTGVLSGIILLGLLTGCGGSKVEIIDDADIDVTEYATATDEAVATPDVATPDMATVDDATPEETTPESAEEETVAANNGKIVVLDPGHSSIVSGSYEPLGPGSSEMKAADSSGTSGAVSGLTEYELNLQVALKLRTELEVRGYTVIMTREDNYTQISCAERAQIANNAGADVFLRIHADGSESSSSSGAMGICITPSNPYIASMYNQSRLLSDDILNAYCAETGMSSRGVWETDTMTGNNWSQVPTTLLEMGFMTNPNEDSLMADSAFQAKIVTGIANGIDKYCFTD